MLQRPNRLIKPTLQESAEDDESTYPLESILGFAGLLNLLLNVFRCEGIACRMTAVDSPWTE